MRTSFGELRRRLHSPSPSFRSRVSKTLLGALTAAIVAAGGSALVAQQTGSGVLPIAASFAGGGPFTGQLSGPVGNCATAPPYSFSGRTTTGLCSPAVDSWALIAGGVTTLTGTSTAVTSAVPILVPDGTAANVALGPATSVNTGFVFPGVGVIDVSSGGTKLFRWNTTQTQLASNGTLEWSSGLIGAASDVSLSRGLTDRMDAGANDSWYIPGGGLGVGVLPPAAGIIKSAGEIQPGTSLQIPAVEFIYWAGRTLISSPASGQSNFTTSTGLAGIGFDFTTDGNLLIRNRAQSAYGNVALGTLQFNTSITNGGVMTVSSTAPSAPVACTTPTVTWSNGTATFQINVGTACTGVSTLTVTLPAAATGWECTASNTTTAARDVWATAWTLTSVTFTNTARTTGLATDWADSTAVRVKCMAG